MTNQRDIAPEVLDAAEVVNQVALPWLQRRIETMGDRSGAQRFYALKLQDAQLLSSRELACASYIARSMAPGSTICEPGIGYGQFPFLLGLLGYRCIGYECDHKRYAGAVGLKAHLACVAPEAASRVVLIGDFFPRGMPNQRVDLVVTTNLVNLGSNRARLSIARAIHALGGGLVDVSTFGRQRDEPREHDALIHEFGVAGLRCDRVFGTTYRLTPATGAASTLLGRARHATRLLRLRARFIGRRSGLIQGPDD